MWMRIKLKRMLLGLFSPGGISDILPQAGVEHPDIDIVTTDRKKRFWNLDFEDKHFDRLSSAMEALSKIPDTFVPEKVFSEVEGFAALVYAMSDTSSIGGMVSIVVLYVRKYIKGPLCGQLVNYVKQQFPMVNQSGGESDVDTTNWRDFASKLRNNWDTIKNSRFFVEFSKVMGLLVVSRMCDLSEIEFSIKGYKIFQPDLAIVHGDAFDVIDALFSTITFFWDRVYMCFSKNSLMPFFLGDTEAVELDNEISEINTFWELVKNGNLQKIKNISDNEFDSRLQKVSDRVKVLLSTSPGKKTYEYKLLRDKYENLVNIRNDYVSLKISSGIRAAPFVIELFGESSQGKTTFGDQIADALNKSMGLSLDKSYRATLNADDKYMSTWTTSKHTMFIDDIANTKPSHTAQPPTSALIDICNNQMHYAVKAEIEAKGKVFVEPKLVILNTNVKDLAVYHYQHCPYAVQRRMDVVITVKAKDCLQHTDSSGKLQGLDPTKVVDYVDDVDAPLDDIWELTLEKAVKPKKMWHVGTYEPIVFNGKKMVNVGIRECVQYLIHANTKHFEAQDRILARMNKRTKCMELCGHDGCNQIKGYCDLHDHIKNQSGEEYVFGEQISNTFSSVRQPLMQKLFGDLFGFAGAMEGISSIMILTFAKSFCNYWDWMMIIPTDWLLHPLFQNLMALGNHKRLRKRFAYQTISMWLMYFFALYVTWATHVNNICGGAEHPIKDWDLCMWQYRMVYFHCFFFGIYCIFRQAFMVKIIRDQYRSELLRRNTISASLTLWRDTHGKTMLAAAGIVGMIVVLARLYKCAAAPVPNQGLLQPISKKDVQNRDSEINVYAVPTKRPMPISVSSRCITAKTLSEQVKKNQYYASITTKEKVMMANCTFISTGYLLLPQHYFIQDELDITLRRDSPNGLGGMFDLKVSKSSSVQIPGTDLRLCYVTRGGSFKSLIKWLPEENLPRHEIKIMWRNKDGSFIEGAGIAKGGKAKNYSASFDGGYYENLSINTFEGMCGATLVSVGKGACISGFHLGGVSGTPVGCYGALTQRQVYDAIEKLEDMGFYQLGSAGTFPMEMYGKPILVDRPLHQKSPLNYLEPSAQMVYVGSTGGQKTSTSGVTVTPISEHVTDVMGQPNIWMAPKMNPQWHSHQQTLSNAAKPSSEYPIDLLERAKTDYRNVLFSIYDKGHVEVRPYTDREIINGIPGIRFVDPINLNTSPGFPLSGDKRKLVIEQDSEDEDWGNRIFVPEVYEEIDRCESCYLLGERAYPISKTFKKDEAVSKVKCRDAFAAALATTYLVRKYFLSMARMIQTHPLESECSVGINCHGPEWQQFENHVLRFGKDRIIAGDYGKYDQRLSSQLIITSLSLLVDVAKRSGNYSSDELKVMKSMIPDIAYAMVEINGDLVMMTEGLHISGNPLTVVLNSICNSLNLRCAFYHNRSAGYFSDWRFQDYVSVGTYGDDNVGTVKPGVDGFNIKTISEFLDSYGQVYTMPDKESELMDFIPMEDFEFLKRKGSFCPDRGCTIGALVEKSIFKSLHCFVRTKKSQDSEEYACAINVDNALREWFNHGRDVYEKRRSQLKEVCSRAKINHLCTLLNKDYDYMLADWKHKYQAKDGERGCA